MGNDSLLVHVQGDIACGLLGHQLTWPPINTTTTSCCLVLLATAATTGPYIRWVPHPLGRFVAVALQRVGATAASTS